MMVASPDVAGVAAVQENGNAIGGRSVGVASAAKFAQGPVGDASRSKLEGTTVWSNDNQKVGDITGIGIGDDGSLSYLVSLQDSGDVAVKPSVISLTYKTERNITDLQNRA
jgi:hypothetical protein